MKPLLRLIDTARMEALLPAPEAPEPGITVSHESRLCIGALNLLLRHALTDCARSGVQAADLLERIAEEPGVDRETRTLCAEASARLSTRPLSVLR